MRVLLDTTGRDRHGPGTLEKLYGSRRGYAYKVMGPGPRSIYIKCAEKHYVVLHGEMCSWLYRTIGDDFHERVKMSYELDIKPNENGVYMGLFYLDFKDDRFATLFKLRWGGEL